MKAILTQTTEEENFDTSDQTSRPCCTPLSFGEEPFPKVRITINGQTMVFSDSAHVLDTKGFDISFTPPEPTNESHQWRLIATVGGQNVVAVAAPTARDINGDGKADLVWQHMTTGHVAVWLLNGATIAGAEVVGQVSDLRWQIAGGGDVDGDGKADLVWRHADTGHVVVWLLNGATIAGAGVVEQVSDLRWQIAAIGDVNGDGKADLVWRHADTGHVVVWLLNGASIAGAGVVTQVDDFGWQIH
jgi:sRNA-binding regulator protein Hfq